MSDYLLQIGKNPQMRKAIKSLGLPIPTPYELVRQVGPARERPLDGQRVLVALPSDGPACQHLAQALPTLGGSVKMVGNEQKLAQLMDAGDWFDKAPTNIVLDDNALGQFRPEVLLYDATGLKTIEQLKALYNFFHSSIGHLSKHGRVVVLAQVASKQQSAEAAGVQAGLEGFIRSLAKELGRRAATANLLLVDDDAASRIGGPLRFFLSPASAYVTGQVLALSTTCKGSFDGPFHQSLKGQTALVTGCARGIGRSTALSLAAEGATVICLDRPEDNEALNKLAGEIEGVPLPVDVTDPQGAEKIHKAVTSRFKGLNILVHNAGVTRDKTLAKMKEDKWDLVMAINLSALVSLTEKLAKTTLVDGARIVMVSSIAGIAGNAGQTNYATSKAGVIGLAQHFAHTLGSRGISVNAVAPGFIETQMTAKMPFAIREGARRMNSLGQGGQPEDVAKAISFFASPACLGVTGQYLRVCGGSLVGK